MASRTNENFARDRLWSTAVQQRPINQYSVISFSIRSADSLTDYSGGVKLVDSSVVVKFFDYPGVVKYFNYPVKSFDSLVEVQTIWLLLCQ